MLYYVRLSSFLSKCCIILVHFTFYIQNITEQIGAVESSLLEKIFRVDFGRLGQYTNKLRRNVFIIRNEWKMGKAECFSKKPEMFYFHKARNDEQCGF